MMQQYKYNTQLKIKRDICIDCGKERQIYSLKRCLYCYKVHSNKARQDRIRERNPQLELEQKLLWEWYCEQVSKLKWRCENCGDRIVDKDKKYNHWHVCHVLGKEHFKSVMTHELNWWEGCHTCHTLYDNYLQNHDERLTQMRIFEKVVSIIQQLNPFVKESRRLNNLPEFILNRLK